MTTFLKTLGYTLRTLALLVALSFIGGLVYLGFQADSQQAYGGVCFLAMFGGVAVMAVTDCLNGIGSDLIDH